MPGSLRPLMFEMDFSAEREARGLAQAGHAAGRGGRFRDDVTDAERYGLLAQVDFDSHAGVTIQYRQ